MQRAGSNKSQPSENLTDSEQNFLKRYSLKKVTVPKDKSKDVANLTVRKEDDDLKELPNPSCEAPKTSTQKHERLEYCDLSKVMRSNTPWWLGTRGAFNNFSGQRLASLVEVTDEEINVKHERLEAGVDKNFRNMNSKCSVDVGEILSKGMEVCLMDSGKSTRKIAQRASSTYNLSNYIEKWPQEKIQDEIEEHESEGVWISDNLIAADSKTDENKAVEVTDSENKTLTSSNSTEMSWIEERLDRVQKLLTSLEDLRLQSGCEKCLGNNGSDYHHHQNSNNVDHGYSKAKGGRGSSELNSLGRRSSLRESVDKELMNSATRSLQYVKNADGSVVEAKVCKCDLDLIDKEMSSLYCFLNELVERQGSRNDRKQYEMIMCRMQEIRECFGDFSKKVLESTQRTTSEEFEMIPAYMENLEKMIKRGSLGDFDNSSNVYCSGSSQATPKYDSFAKETKFLQPPASWCQHNKEQSGNGNCTKKVFVPCFFYDPSTGECKFEESSDTLQSQPTTQFGCSCHQNACIDDNFIDIDENLLEDCECCMADEPANNGFGVKKICPLNLAEILSPAPTIANKKEKNKCCTCCSSKKKNKSELKVKDENGENYKVNLALAGNTHRSVPKLRFPEKNYENYYTNCINQSVPEILLQDSRNRCEDPSLEQSCNQNLQKNTQMLPSDPKKEDPKNVKSSSCSCCCSKESAKDEKRSKSMPAGEPKHSNQNSQKSKNHTIIRIKTECCPPQESKQQPSIKSRQEPPSKSRHEHQSISNQETDDLQGEVSQGPSKRSSQVIFEVLPIKPDTHNDDAKQQDEQKLTVDQSSKTTKPAVSFKQQEPSKPLNEEQSAQSPVDELSKKIGDVVKQLYDDSFKKLSEANPDKQIVEIPCEALYDLCKKSCEGAIEKIKDSFSNQNNQQELREKLNEAVSEKSFEMQGNKSSENPSQKLAENPLQKLSEDSAEKPSEKPRCVCDELLKHYEISQNCMKPIFDSNNTKPKSDHDSSNEDDNDNKDTKQSESVTVSKKSSKIQSNKSSDMQSKRSSEDPLENPSNNSAEEPAEKPTKETSDKPFEKPSKKSSENLTEKPSENLTEKSSEKLRSERAELLKNYKICSNCVKPIFNTNNINPKGNGDLSVQKSSPRFNSKLDNYQSPKKIMPARGYTFSLNSSQPLPDPQFSPYDINSDSFESVISASGGDAANSSHCQCCFCECVPPIEADLANIIQNRIKNRKRGTVYLKFTMSPNSLFHIQMATVDNKFLGCFNATEAAVMEARRTNGFDGCITLSVMEPSNSPSQINRLVDHAFMVVQEDRRNK